MSSEKASLTSKLTLLVLTLILVCLGMLVARVYQNPVTREPDGPASAEVGSWPIEPPTVAKPAPSTRSPSSVTTNGIRRPAPVPTSSSIADTALVGPEQTPPVQEGGENPNSSAFTAVNVVDGALSGNATSGNLPSIIGLVTLLGTPKPEVPIPLGATCGELRTNQVTTRHYVVNKNGGLANVVVSLKNVKKVHSMPASESEPILDQVGCMFEPYVMGVMTGQRFKIRNSDPTLHNIHATPMLNREFNIGQARQHQINEKSFATAELFVRIKCDVHPWMFAYISVFDHPFFAISDTNGLFRLPSGFPAGEYVVGAAHLRTFGRAEIKAKVRIAEGEQKVLTFQFDVSSPDQPRGVVSIR